MRYCLALDLKDNDESIREYERWHQNVWPEVLASIRESGIMGMEIFRAGNRLFMIMETSSDFSFERKSQADNANPTVQQWEKLMWNYQQALPFAQPGEKWILMQKIFSLD
jgi:L-rhamnose mutarotase